MNKAKWFTLVETIIVLVIIWILSIVLMKTYTFISQISFRIEQEKKVTQEILFISQIIQNFSDRNSIDYDKYHTKLWTWFLSIKKWLTKILYLSWQDWNIEIYSTWTCLDPWISIDFLTWWYQCHLQVNNNWQIVDISNPKTTYLSQVIFKIVPYDSPQNYINWISTCTNYIGCIHKPWFFIISKAYSITYNQHRYNRINIPIQQFFNSIDNND